MTQCKQQRTRDQEPVAEQGILGQLDAARLGKADGEQLPGIVPLIQRFGDVDSLITLQPYERGLQRGGKCLGGLGLADSGLALDEHRLAQPRRAKQRHDRAVVGEVVDTVERVAQGLKIRQKLRDARVLDHCAYAKGLSRYAFRQPVPQK